MVHYEVDLHDLEIERVPSLLDRRVVVETRRRKSRRIRGDVCELCILHERVPLHEVLAERLDQDVVGAERRESLGQRRRQWGRLVVLGWWKNEFPRDPVGARGGEAGQTEVRVS